MKKMYKVLIIFSAILGINLFSDNCESGYITIKVDTRATVNENRLKLDINLTNNGNEAAYNVVVSADLYGERKVSKKNEKLDVKKELSVKFDYELNLERQGTYSVVLTVNYADANLHGFSVISVPQFNYMENVSPLLSCNIDKLYLSKRGDLNLSLKNLDENEKNIESRVVLSRELTISNPIQNIKLMPKSEKNITYNVKNTTAIEGSSYACYAILEYVFNDKHYSHVSSGIIKVIAGKKFVIKYKWIIIVSVSIIFVVFVALQFFSKK